MIVIQAEYYDTFFKKNRIGYFGYDCKGGMPCMIENIISKDIEKFETVDAAIDFIRNNYVRDRNSFVDMHEKFIGNPKVVKVNIKPEIVELWEYIGKGWDVNE